jgi:hypothetical protein
MNPGMDELDAFDALELLPLRQMVRPAQGSANLFAAPGILQALSRRDRFRILRHGGGGQILARNGLALAEAQLMLRQAYGPCIAFGTPTAHRVIDHATGTILVPMMFVRIDAPVAYRQELLQLLAQRSAPAGEIASERDRIVLRMESPLARLIGLERQVLEGTDGAAQILCWLSRYSPAAPTNVDEARHIRETRDI